MKTLIPTVALSLSLIAAPAQANDFWSGILAGVVVAAIVSESREPEWQQRQRLEAMSIGSPPPIVITPQPRVEIKPAEDSRSQYLRECQRYGYTLNRCRKIWDGPEVEQDETMFQKQIIIPGRT